jgi:polysaccharide biosynthesis/export protein
MTRIWSCLVIVLVAGTFTVQAQTAAPPKETELLANVSKTTMQTTDDWNQRLQELVHSALSKDQNNPSAGDYRIGPNDLLTITVLEAPDLSQPVRVSADGEISMPLLGNIKAAGLTPRELELVLQALLRRTYMKDPHVSVAVTEMQSHTVSVLGAVKNPGAFQIRGTKTLLEMLSMAGGLAPEAGNAVLVMRGAAAEYVRDGRPRVQNVSTAEGRAAVSNPATISSSGKAGNEDTVEVSLKQLLDTGDPKYNVPVYPGDIVKVKAAGIVYVVGDVTKPGGFPVQDNDHISVLQAIALGGGLAPDADKSRATIIRVAQNGEQIDLPIHLGKILSGKSPDLPLRPKDVLFVPNNGAKSAGRSALKTFAQWIVWRGIP